MNRPEMNKRSKNIMLHDSEVLLLGEKNKKGIKFDFILPAIVLLVTGFGLLIIYSATRYSMPDGVNDPMFYLKKQGITFIIAFSVFMGMQFINYRVYQKYWYVFLLLIVMLLGSVLIFGYVVNQSKSWIDLKFTSVQPSEFAKILMVLVVSALLSKWPREKANKVGFKKVAYSFVAVLLATGLVVLEPDYGTAFIFFITYMGILFLSGANILYFFGILAATVGGFFTAVQIGLIKQYQLDRILVFLKPDIEKQGIGYNLYQSKLAIGSGGIWGQGLFMGKHTNLSYVPESHTDFIFSVIGEEVGFFGSAVVIILLALIIWRCFYIAHRAHNSFGTLVAGGIGFIILSQVVINIGMTIGIMPVIGIPLPFLSYGGSNLLAIFIGIGLVENIYFKRDTRKGYEIAYDEFD